MTTAVDGAARAKLDAVRAKYRAEREKRLRPDGVGQYRALSGTFEDFDRDPYADPAFTRAPVTEDVEVAIIGAGIGGLMAAAKLVQQGVTDLRIIDKAGDFGGTWYWNRYPGAACDIESYVYMPMLDETGYVPTEKYAKAPEIFAHCQRIGTQFGLYDKALFQTLVQDVRWSDDDGRWTISTSRGDTLRARFLIVAGGILHKAKLPGIPGVETFRGKSFHTSRWDYGYTGGSPTERMDRLVDKRVALIGTGATSIQVVPRLAETAQHLYVVQRTPSTVGVRANRPTDPEWAGTLQPGWQKARMENFTQTVSGRQPEVDMVDDGFTAIFGRNPNALGISTEAEELSDLEAMEAVRARVDTIITDPETAEALKPWYNQMCKRPCFHDDYLPAFNRPNVTLVDTGGKGVERITEDAVVVDGVSYPVDCIVYGSGFEVGSGYKSRLGFEIHGRDGIALTDAWADGPATLHGMLARGFPNLMIFDQLQGGIAINFAHLMTELADHASWLIAHCVKEGIGTIEPTAEAQEAWFQTLLSKLGAQAMFFAQCTPGYFNAEGSTAMSPAAMRSVPYFGPLPDFLGVLHDWRNAPALEGVELHPITRKGE
ncbi:flavin-containing monooxygenase [Sphingomonas solaris]|uniref:NAD(P)/FAD-dependent oxidoreductase n=1 Tax=Alterirhizorhabdus solaris TaxID=2529389 RepID=A0A558RA80_9SPHN|nr:NAD(P)/FAD-dependent oxidoreductase [Sphingomonas solaris]TVV76268.1 NAD(P)/FAD-dependent oxidoreductase [Sphingomonas solaris]